MLVGRSRCFSWQADEVVVQRSDSGHHAALEPQPQQVPAGAAPAQPGRVAELAELQAYLDGLSNTVDVPEAFSVQVHQAVEEQRRACAVQRGWVATASAADAGPAAASPLPVACSATDECEPKLGAALLKVQQLDAELAAANQRAAAVAEAGRKLEQACGDADVTDDTSASPNAGLEGAMARERRRLRHKDRVLQALQEGAEECASAEAAVPGSQASQLTGEQEALVEALLSQGEAAAADAADPFAAASAELEGIEVQLAALHEGCASGVDSLGAPVLSGPGFEARLAPDEAQLDVEADQEEPDVQGAMSRVHRAQQEAREVAQQLRSIDAAVRALRVGGHGMLA